MAAQARTLTTFLIDVGPSMGEKHTLEEEVLDEEKNVKKVTRTVTKLEWCMEFVIRKVQQSILSGLATSKMCVILVNSTQTDNVLASRGQAGSYGGVNEIWPPERPNVTLLERLKNLRARPRNSAPAANVGDMLDALVVAISGADDKAHSQCTPTWTKYIYVVTDAKTTLNMADVDTIKQRVVSSKFKVRVMGVGFRSEYGDEDDDVEDGKQDPAVAEIEDFWHGFLEGVEGCGVTSAADAVSSTRLPTLMLKKSTGVGATLSLGEAKADKLGREVPYGLEIPVRVYKHTMLARPISRTDIASIMPSAAGMGDDRGEGTSAAGARGGAPDGKAMRMSAYYDMAEALKVGMENLDKVKPLSAERTMERGYKLGATVVPLPIDEKAEAKNSISSIQIINFGRWKDFHREWEVGEVSYLFADWGGNRGEEAQVMISAIAKALDEMQQWALARYVSKNEAAPRLVMLWPKCVPDWDCLIMVNVAFMDDMRKYSFPSLFRAKTASGEWTQHHKSIPNAEQQAAMNNYLDRMDLGTEELPMTGKVIGTWYNIEESFNPGLHRVNQVVAHRATYPDRGLPPPHPLLSRFLDRKPLETEEEEEERDEAQQAAMVAFDIIRHEKPVKRKRGRDGEEDEAVGEADEAEEAAGEAEGSSEKRARVRHPQEELDEEEDETGVEFDAEYPPTGAVLDLERPNEDLEDKVNEGRTDPGEALREAQRTILHLWRQSAGARETNWGTIRELMERGRQIAGEEDEALGWNKFLRMFKKEIVEGDVSDKQFWNKHFAGNTSLGLITSQGDRNKRIKRVHHRHAATFVTKVPLH